MRPKIVRVLQPAELHAGMDWSQVEAIDVKINTPLYLSPTEAMKALYSFYVYDEMSAHSHFTSQLENRLIRLSDFAKAFPHVHKELIIYTSDIPSKCVDHSSNTLQIPFASFHNKSWMYIVDPKLPEDGYYLTLLQSSADPTMLIPIKTIVPSKDHVIYGTRNKGKLQILNSYIKRRSNWAITMDYDYGAKLMDVLDEWEEEYKRMNQYHTALSTPF